tara:strand:- start:11734 stop:11892 length:159 start_codon:yes stop_codon:yes gene_type:complete
MAEDEREIAAFEAVDEMDDIIRDIQTGEITSETLMGIRSRLSGIVERLGPLV